MVDDLPEAGDYRTLKVGRCPLVVIRGKDGALRCFHNVCRHRGMQPLEGAGNAARGVVCPYHRWTYELDGRLRGMPDRETLFPGLDAARLALKPAALGVLDRMAFVCPELEPKDDFETFRADLDRHGWPHDVSRLEETQPSPLPHPLQLEALRRKRHGTATIWPISTTGRSRARGRNGSTGRPPGATGCGTGRANRRRGATARWPSSPEPTPNRRGRACGGSSRLPACWRPASSGPCSGWSRTAPEACFLDTRTWIQPGQDEAKRAYEDLFPGSRHRRDGAPEAIALDRLDVHPMETLDFQIEDMWVVERLQEAIASPAFEVGPLSLDTEASLTHFQQSVLDHMPPQAALTDRG